MGVIFPGGGYLQGVIFEGKKFWGVIFTGGSFHRGNIHTGGIFIEGNFLGGNYLGGNFLGGNFPDTCLNTAFPTFPFCMKNKEHGVFNNVLFFIRLKYAQLLKKCLKSIYSHSLSDAKTVPMKTDGISDTKYMTMR